MKLREPMKLSEKTVNLLKNFASINQSIAFKKGNTLRTMSVMKNILAEAEIEEEIPRDFAIYDLVQFLNGVTLHDNPSIEFPNESNLTIREGKDRKTKYFFADPSVIVSPPEKSIQLPTEDVCFKLDSTQLQSLLKASAVYQLPIWWQLVKQAWSNWWFVTRRTTPPMNIPSMLVRLIKSSTLTLKLRTSRFSPALMRL